MIENIGTAFLLTFLAGLATAIGGGIAFVVKPDNLKALSIGLGFSAGVMIFLSLTEIIPAAAETLTQYFPHSHDWLVYASFIIGIIIALLIDYFLPDHIDQDEVLHPDDPCLHRHKIKKAGLFTAIAICVHNFPEGMATFLSTTQSLQLGASVAIAIAIHNIPEGLAVGFAFGAAAVEGTPGAFAAALGLAAGMAIQNFPEGAAVSLPLKASTGSRGKAFLLGAGSGAVEPVCALAGYFLASHLSFAQPWFLAFAAGAMIFVVAEDLIPDAHLGKYPHLGTWGMMLGFVIMMVLDVALG